MTVVDTSAVLAVLVGDTPDAALVSRIAGSELHAPHLIDVEVLHALRVLLTRRAASIDKIEAARQQFGLLAMTRYPHTPLRERMWELRNNLSAYDAAYVALAEALTMPLITSDERIARAAGPRTVIDVYGPA